METVKITLQVEKNGLNGSDELEVNIMSEQEHNGMLNAVKFQSRKLAKELEQQAQGVLVRILTSTEGREGIDVYPRAVVVSRDDEMLSVKRNMVRPAREIITEAEKLGEPDPILPEILVSVIQGESLWKNSLGEFFELYGRFEGKYGRGYSKVVPKMKELLEDANREEAYFSGYKYRDNPPEDVPLPFAVRNILAHQDDGQNSLDSEGRQLKTAIDLLRKLLPDSKQLKACDG